MRDDFEAFVQALHRIDAQLPSEAARWMRACGEMFLDEVQREIIRSQTVDTRRLLNSFSKGSSDGVWVARGGGLTLEVGTNVQYAKWANDGHFTTDGRASRWVPGTWVGDRFEYNPSSKEGMLLKLKWVQGSAYFDTAFAIYKRMFQKSISNKYKAYMLSQLRGGGRF